jgi:cyclase
MSTSHHDPDTAGSPRVEEVADGVFAYIQPDGSWFLNNTGFVRGHSGVLSIDTCSTERRTRAYLQTVEAVTGSTVRTLVNTHHHGDHTNGNYLLPAATIIGQENCREAMIKSGILRPDGLFEPVEWGDLECAPPFVTFDRRLNVYVDDLLVELIHISSAAHTTNDVVGWISEHRVLFAGDLVLNGCTPFVLMGSVAGALESLDAVMELEPEIIVPGHGATGGLEAVAVCGEYLRTVQNHAESTKAAGLSPLESARAFDQGPFAGLLDGERIAGNLHRAYADLDGVEPGGDIDYRAAFADMVTLNGGRPLRCLA